MVIRTLSASLTQLIAQGGLRDANLANRKALALEALANYEQSVRLAFEQVENQLSAINNSMERLNALKNAATASERSFEQANTLYQLGLVSFLDVVDAQRVLANAQQALAIEQTRQATLIAGLFQVLGQGPEVTNP